MELKLQKLYTFLKKVVKRMQSRLKVSSRGHKVNGEETPTVKLHSKINYQQLNQRTVWSAAYPQATAKFLSTGKSAAHGIGLVAFRVEHGFGLHAMLIDLHLAMQIAVPRTHALHIKFLVSGLLAHC